MSGANIRMRANKDQEELSTRSSRSIERTDGGRGNETELTVGLSVTDYKMVSCLGSCIIFRALFTWRDAQKIEWQIFTEP